MQHWVGGGHEGLPPRSLSHAGGGVRRMLLCHIPSARAGLPPPQKTLPMLRKPRAPAHTHSKGAQQSFFPAQSRGWKKRGGDSTQDKSKAPTSACSPSPTESPPPLTMALLLRREETRKTFLEAGRDLGGGGRRFLQATQAQALAVDAVLLQGGGAQPLLADSSHSPHPLLAPHYGHSCSWMPKSAPPLGFFPTGQSQPHLCPQTSLGGFRRQREAKGGAIPGLELLRARRAAWSSFQVLGGSPAVRPPGWVRGLCPRDGDKARVGASFG